MSQPCVLRARGLTQRYPGVLALDGVDLCLRAGEVHALMGQNGAGKSTLVRIITGASRPTAGVLELDGRRLQPESPAEARRMGISAVFQEVNLCPNLTVAENIMAGSYPRRGWHRGGGIDWSGLERSARTALDTLHLDIDPRRQLAHYSVAVQQMVAVARAIQVPARVLVLDEPTSSLDDEEVRQCFAVLRRLRESGLAILFITHFLEQVYELADRITVLRNGRQVGEFPAAELGRDALIAAMIGTDTRLAEVQQRRGAAAAAGSEATEPLLRARALGRRGRVHPVDVDVLAGEVLGVAGLLGAGRTELARMLAGLDQPDSGSITMGRAEVRFASPAKAIAHGVAYCPEERKTDGIVAELSVRENIVLALQARTGLLPRHGQRRLLALAMRFVTTLGIRCASVETPAGQLSGGNQQKLILARWLAIQPLLLILDEPTRGVDIAAKAELMNELTRLADAGMAIVFISAEIDEVVRVAGRILVMCDQRKVGELQGRCAVQDVFHMMAGRA